MITHSVLGFIRVRGIEWGSLDLDGSGTVRR